MKKETVKFTVRLHPDTAKKLVFISEYWGRSQNRQIDWLVKQCITEFEQEHGPIDLQDS